MQSSRWNYPTWVPISIGLFLRLIHVQVPLLGVHSWRQADTAAMARHFTIGGTPIWLPQIDWSGASPGYVESEFPLFPYLTSQFYSLFGIHEWIGRCLSAIFSVLTIFILIRIGEQLLDPISGWWGGLFFAIMPLSVYYGRTFQAESLMMFFSALCIERLLAWKKHQKIWALLSSWLMFCLACLLKVLPLAWLGIPLLMIQLQSEPLQSANPINQLWRKLLDLGRSVWPWIYLGSTVSICAIWFGHAYQMGQASGLSFGFWGPSSDRSSFGMLLDLRLWLNLLIRISLRNLAVLGLPLVLLGLWDSRKKAGAQILGAGLLGVFFCTAIALRASSIHEYYQLPFQLFLCPFMGRGLLVFKKLIQRKNLPQIFITTTISLTLTISLLVLTFDYWAVELRQTEVWMPLAHSIRKTVQENNRIVSVTDSDPTLLNLAQRQGWLTSADEVNQSTLHDWAKSGATHIVGSLNWKEIHIRRPAGKSRDRLQMIFCSTQSEIYCPKPPNDNFLVPIKELLK